MDERAGVVSREKLDSYVEQAAKAAGYEEGFGVRGCDLSLSCWWAAYIRQSLEEQTHNSRLPDYLRTCAQEAKRLGVIVPREYILYDAVTGEHLQRPDMVRLRRLVAERRLAGVVFPALDRLSREPLHQQIFELEATYYGVRLHYADAPSGNDPGSQFARSILAHAAKLVKLSNRKNARGGNIGRVIKGWVPAHRAAYGYRYCADREIGPDGRVVIKRAWWEIDSLEIDGQPVQGSPAWVVRQIFAWVGSEGRTLYWVANRLNRMGIAAPQGGAWSPARVSHIVHHRCYTGNHAYNTRAKEVNPARPLGDITGEIRRTLVRPKPEEEWVRYKIPPLVEEELWKRADAVITERGRGKGKQGKRIQALLRNRVFCPMCGRPMVVRRDGRQNRVYYHCSRYFRPWEENPCNYRRFIPATWDELVWGDICRWLRNDAWVEQQLASDLSQDGNTAKLVRLQQLKISQARGRIARVHEGFEGGIYTLEEARRRLAGLEESISRAEAESRRLQGGMRARASRPADLQAMRDELRALRDMNLDEASFEERLDIISTLGIRVHPSEDLKSMRVLCQMNLEQLQPRGDGGMAQPRLPGRTTENSVPERGRADGAGDSASVDDSRQPSQSDKPRAEGEPNLTTACGIVRFAPPFRMKGKTFSKTFALVR